MDAKEKLDKLGARIKAARERLGEIQKTENIKQKNDRLVVLCDSVSMDKESKKGGKS